MGEDGPSDDYDPHGDRKDDPRERRRIRHEYRELISETQRNRHDFIKPESTGLHQALEKAEGLFKKATHTREAVLDSHFLVLASNLGSQQAQQLQTHLVTFDPDVFAEKLITFMGGRNVSDMTGGNNEDEETPAQRRQPPRHLDWKKLGRKASVAFRRTPNVDFMFGPLSMEPPVKVRRDRNAMKKTEKPDANQLVKPRQLEKVETKEEATTKEVDRLHQILFNNTVSEEGEEYEITPVSLFDFIINPNSFGQTIENLFHLSFLVRDGRAEISLDNQGLPVVSYQEMPSEDEQTGKQQVVVRLTLKEYGEIIKTFNIRRPMIPPRPRMGLANDAGLSNDRNESDDEGEGDDN